jgi:hypothetical protein
MTMLIEVEPHRHQGEHAGVIRFWPEYRCAACGHRLTVDAVPPVETRKQPVSAWLPEIRDRRRARLVGKWTKGTRS